MYFKALRAYLNSLQTNSFLDKRATYQVKGYFKEQENLALPLPKEGSINKMNKI